MTTLSWLLCWIGVVLLAANHHQGGVLAFCQPSSSSSATVPEAIRSRDPSMFYSPTPSSEQNNGDDDENKVDAIRSTSGSSSSDDDDDDDKNDAIVLDQKAREFRQLVPLWLAFVAFWPTLTAVRIFLATHEFDVDTYLTLQSVQQQAATLADGDVDMILELPPLSPAEQLVDAFFGPNKVDRRGF